MIFISCQGLLKASDSSKNCEANVSTLSQKGSFLTFHMPYCNMTSTLSPSPMGKHCFSLNENLHMQGSSVNDLFSVTIWMNTICKENSIFFFSRNLQSKALNFLQKFLHYKRYRSPFKICADYRHFQRKHGSIIYT